MSGARRAVAVLTVLLGVGVLGACTGESGEAPSASPSVSATVTSSPGEAGTPGEDDAADADDDGGTDAAPGGDEPAAPGTGDALPTAPPVAFEDEADFGTGVTAEVVAVDAIEAEAQGPGEISGPALAFEVEVTNGGAAAVSLDAVTVNLADAQGTPGLPMLGAPAKPFGGTLAPGTSATGVYVFTLSPDGRDTVTLELSYTTEAPVVLFQGDPQDA